MKNIIRLSRHEDAVLLGKYMGNEWPMLKNHKIINNLRTRHPFQVLLGKVMLNKKNHMSTCPFTIFKLTPKSFTKWSLTGEKHAKI